MHAFASPEAPVLEQPAVVLDEHIVEVISDSGEGAQRCGQSLGAIAARMGNGIWTTEIIPAEIQPPARSVAGASGIRIRIGSSPVSNGGDETDLVVAFNEQVLIGRVSAGELKPGATILLEDMWREHRDPKVVASYEKTVAMLRESGFRLYELPLDKACAKLVADPRKGKNMFVLGILCYIYSLDSKFAHDQVALTFGKKDPKVVKVNQGLVDAGRAWAAEHIDFRFRIPAQPVKQAQVVVNGNTAIGLGVLASGMDICSMYPITPATSASHYLSECFERVGGMVHQAEDEIAACTFAIGASYAGKCAVTITSGPGSRLRRESLLAGLLARATDAEQQFLRGLILRNLRQGALEGVMADATVRLRVFGLRERAARFREAPPDKGRIAARFLDEDDVAPRGIYHDSYHANEAETAAVLVEIEGCCAGRCSGENRSEGTSQSVLDWTQSGSPAAEGVSVRRRVRVYPSRRRQGDSRT